MEQYRLQAIDLTKIFDDGKKGPVTAIDHVNLEVKDGEFVMIVGPSGCGKTTLINILGGLNTATSGEVLLDGNPLSSKGVCPVQLIYQHPEKAVNPRWKMNDILREAWSPDDALLKRVGIEQEWLKRWPRELSGGELQRFCVARALGPETKFLLSDEMTTMLDVITQAQIWNLVIDIVKEREMGLIVVTHNMALADRVCFRKVNLAEINNI